MSGTDIKIFKKGSLDEIVSRGIEPNSREVWDVVNELKVHEINFDYPLYIFFLDLNFLPRDIRDGHGTFLPLDRPVTKESYSRLKAVRNLSDKAADEAWVWCRLLRGYTPDNEEPEWFAFLNNFEYFSGCLTGGEIRRLSRSSEAEGYLPYLAAIIRKHVYYGKHPWLRQLGFIDKIIDISRTGYREHLFLTFNYD